MNRIDRADHADRADRADHANGTMCWLTVRVQQRAALTLSCVLGSLLSACIVVPVIDHSMPIPCPLVTRRLTLTVVDLQLAQNCRREDCIMAVAVNGAVFVGSMLVSGSVAIVGNTVHWMERDARCPRREEEVIRVPLDPLLPANR